MNPSFEQSIVSMVISAIVIAIFAIQIRHNDNIVSLQKLIKKSLLLKDFLFATFSSDPDAIVKASLFTNIFLKTLVKRWNQANFGYIDPHLDKVHRKNKIIFVEKNIYYRNVIFFVQRF